MKVILKRKADSWSSIKMYANCSHYLAPYFTRRGRLYTGLEDAKDEQRLGEVLRVDLSPKSDYWKTYFIKLDSKNEVVLQDVVNNPKDELDYMFLIGHKNVQNGPRDKTRPKAEYILISDESSAKLINTEAKYKITAIKEFDKLTPEEMRKVLRLYGMRANEVSNEVVQSHLYELIEEDPKKFLNIWVDNKNREVQFVIEEAVANNILRKSNTTYKYGTDIIGYTVDEAIDYLRNPANSDLYNSIKSQISGKKGMLKRDEQSTAKSQVQEIKEVIEKEEVKEKPKSKKAE